MSSSISTCNGMTSALASTTKAIDQSTTQLQSYYSHMKGATSNYVNQYISVGTMDANKVMNSVTSQVNAEVSKLKSEIQSYTGTCLNSIINPIQNSINAIENYGTSITGVASQTLGGISGIIVNAVNSVFNFSGLLNSMGIGALVSAVDNLFGCLSSASCLPFGSIQKSMNKVTGLLKSVGLSSNANFDWSTWASTISDSFANLPQKIWTAITDGFQKMWDGMVNLFSTLKDNLQSILNGIQNFSLSSITGGLGSIMSTVGGAVGKVASALGGGASQAPIAKQDAAGFAPRMDGFEDDDTSNGLLSNGTS